MKAYYNCVEYKENVDLWGYLHKFLFIFLGFLDDSMRKGRYYRERLSGNNLLRCYELAPPRIKQYLNAEIQFVISNLQSEDLVLELGCGYGRVMKEVSPFVSHVVGNDISKASLKLARSYMESCQNYTLFLMDASQMTFRPCSFDVVFCIQNGISAFGVNSKCLIAESKRVTKGFSRGAPGSRAARPSAFQSADSGFSGRPSHRRIFPADPGRKG